jgi:TPR repeat protein
MASREFLKILSSARLGDVLAQQKLAQAYMTGSFKTPIQPTNALIWLEKSYFSITNQVLEDQSVIADEVAELLAQVANIPLAETFNSTAFGFGWSSFWDLAEKSTQDSSSLAAKWQLANLLMNPAYEEIQLKLVDWLSKAVAEPSIEKVVKLDFSGLQKLAQEYLYELSEKDSPFTASAKELLIRLQPKNEVLSSLWNAWLEDENQEALVRSAELGLTVAKLTLGLRLAQLDGSETKSNASLKKAAHWLELAAKDGDRDAWYALGEIYRRPQFSGYNAKESDRCFDRAADLGHAKAQLRKGANLWRKREKSEEKVQGLQAS